MRLTYKRNGKTIAEALLTPTAVRKVQRRPWSSATSANSARGDRGQLVGLPLATYGRHSDCPGKKRPKQSARKSREVDQLLRLIVTGRRKSGHVDLEAVASAVCSALHRAGAATLTELLQSPAPAGAQRQMLSRCGHSACYRGLRSRPLLTALGPAEVSRPYYLCPHCSAGQFPADVKLDIEDTEFSPGVRRMQVVVG